MKYFSPETSKKLEEMGLIQDERNTNYYEEPMELIVSAFSTLDICEIENAKKLWHHPAREDVAVVQIKDLPRTENEVSWTTYGLPDYLRNLAYYITLSDEKRIKYVEDYLNITSDK